MAFTILVRRSGALGDVVLTTPVVRRLARENPDATVLVHTNYPEVFAGCSYAAAVRGAPALPPFDRLVNLDLAYERRPKMHIVRAYMEEAFGEAGEPDADWQQEMADTGPAAMRLSFNRPFIVVHGNGGIAWRNRIQSPGFWCETHRLLQGLGYMTISIGRTGDDGQGSMDARNMFGVPGVRRLIKQAACFVGSDSGPLHIAGTTQAPIVGLFTCALPQFRLPWRNGQLADRCIGLMPPRLECVGCLHDEPPPVTSLGCRVGNYACVEDVHAAISPEMVREAVISLVGEAV